VSARGWPLVQVRLDNMHAYPIQQLLVFEASTLVLVYNTMWKDQTQGGNTRQAAVYTPPPTRFGRFVIHSSISARANLQIVCWQPCCRERTSGSPSRGVRQAPGTSGRPVLPRSARESFSTNKSLIQCCMLAVPNSHQDLGNGEPLVSAWPPGRKELVQDVPSPSLYTWLHTRVQNSSRVMQEDCQHCFSCMHAT
jgi:hypothetical protein